jgi:exopolyphosphatase / guanosine-5'-triphosphate,3'-diphosphate pyrophosphatase
VRPAAALDIGSNSVKLLIVDASSGELRPLGDMAKVPRLSRGMTDRLTDTAMDETAETVRGLVAFARELGCDPILAVGTACLREAANAREFTDRIKNETNIDVRVIAGPDEARLSYLGALSMQRPAWGHFTVVDIGGRSSEITLGSGMRTLSQTSLPLGAVGLTERFETADICPPECWSELESYIDSRLGRLEPTSVETTTIAVGGVATALALLRLELEQFDGGKVAQVVFRLDELETLLERLRNLPLAEREKLPGMPAGRADILPAGAAILCGIMRRLHDQKIRISDRGLRHGVIMDYLLQQTTDREA